jgi:hypothetical protein
MRANQVLEAAERQAAEITRQATDQATAIREAADREAADVRSQLDSMYAELGRVVEFLTETLAAAPATAPALPGARPGIPSPKQAPPDGLPKPAGPAPARPAGPVAKPAGRQSKVARKFVAAFAVVSLVGAVSGATELALHGMPFFVFRANGAGATETGPKEPENPPKAGQPFDPGATQKPGAHAKSTPSTKTAAQAKAGAHRKPAPASTGITK